MYFTRTRERQRLGHLFIPPVAPFRRPLGTFHQQLSSTPKHRAGKAKNSAASLNLPEAYFTCEPFGFPMILLAVEGTRCPLAGGLVGFVALQCYAQKCAFSLSTHKHKTTFGTSLSTSESNRRTAQPERRPDGQTASDFFAGIPPSLFVHAPCPLHNGGART
jgi:hypothetical protein